MKYLDQIFSVPIIVIALVVIAMIVLLVSHKRKVERKRETEQRLKEEHESRLALIHSIEPVVDSYFEEVCSFYNYDHYITESERLGLLSKFEALLNSLRTIADCEELAESPKNEEISRLYKALSGSSEYKNDNNRHFIARQLSEQKDYFDSVLTYPLDAQQRESIVSLEDNVLVISSAGSGKTMTTVGKVRYLIDKQGVDPKKILLITFTRKAAESLSVRLGESDLKCVTFHKLALDIIAEYYGKKPSITAPDFSIQVYQKLMRENMHFKRSVADYILQSRYKMPDAFEYDSEEKYMRDRKKYGVHAYYADMDGKSIFCKSDQESQICDYLGGRGIKFRYEEKYQFPVSDREHRQYTPDFSIYFKGENGVEYRIYLEHFAVDECGRCPKWFSAEEECNYLADRAWKRDLHKRNGTVLLETTSADFHRGNVFEKLEQELLKYGVKIGENKRNDVSHELLRQEQNILDMLTSFNFLMKSKSRTINDILSLRVKGQDRMVINNIVAPFVQEYQDLENSQDEIDFTDAIVKATAICNNGHRHDYDYILVDEFQDISMDRYRFLQSLRRRAPLTKLFCVGDDWQSIYRFAGSDMALFKSFSNFFGYTKECRMETTYRFGYPLIDVSSKFILANPEQKEKNVHSFNSEALTNIDFIATHGKEDVVDKVRALIECLPADKDVYLLGRYSFDVNVLKDSDFVIKEKAGQVSVGYKGREVPFMTVHQSKGLESDYVILLNCNAGTLGFPADIADSPVLRYVLSEPDGYAYGEERRVFYVGITRAKKHTYVLYEQDRPSPFVSEFVKTDPKDAPEDNIPPEELCPKCHCGRVETVHKGIAVNGNPYYLLSCSNQRYGCTYREMKFVNLNSRMKSKVKS